MATVNCLEPSVPKAMSDSMEVAQSWEFNQVKGFKDY
jgi:hypothetical protein